MPIGSSHVDHDYEEDQAGERSSIAIPTVYPQPLCATCAIVHDLAEIAQTDLQEGRFDDVDKALRIMRAHLTGALGVEVR
jgi:hypothetical protein